LGGRLRGDCREVHQQSIDWMMMMIGRRSSNAIRGGILQSPDVGVREPICGATGDVAVVVGCGQCGHCGALSRASLFSSLEAPVWQFGCSCIVNTEQPFAKVSSCSPSKMTTFGK